MEKQSTSIALSSIALVFVLVRTAIRLRYQKRLLIDDVFLYLGVICLCVATGLLVQFSSAIYIDGENSVPTDMGMGALLDGLTSVPRFNKTS